MGTGELSKITNLAHQLIETDAQLAEAQSVVQALERKRDRLASELLPAAMDECGQTSVGLPGGKRLEIVEIVRASIPKDRQLEAFTWLRGQGYAALIKRSISCVFGKGKDNVAGAFYDMCLKRGYEPTQKVGVHPSTLSAFVRDRLAAGKDVPMESLGVFRKREAEVLDPKVPRKKRASHSEDDE